MKFHDAWFFVGVFIFIFLIWVITGGPTHPLAFSGPALPTPQQIGGSGTYVSFPKAPFAIGTTHTTLQGSSSGGGSAPTSISGRANSGTPAPILVGTVPFGEVSPYRGLVSINHSVSGAGSTDPGNEYVQISVAQNAGVPVDLTGWTLESEATGKAVVIPKGTDVPMSGIVNPAQDIVLLPGERAIVVTGQSPIGASFRENKCIGYFSTFQHFSPSLPNNCPTPSNELLAFYGSGYIRDAACIDYVNKIPRCQVTLTPPVNTTSACQAFLIKYLNYNGCVDAHRNDADFKGNTWRIYLGRTASMWRTKYEVVKLLDASGKTVDAFSY
ncbi:MAG: hypothetical protein KGH97_03890 [Patescibacteria group bacterium]|nr:hypothetical protein [Patescibacteria group bacterium]